ncbi:MAG: 50S ribosomal protein L18 [Legionellales bacterium]|nr:50S ribosomal protein L18 [Legionellales bacterium]|tara:strand:+ start:7973 stop:8371 length:399 start_codon:yes stop_codon:yes gene_type:complete
MADKQTKEKALGRVRRSRNSGGQIKKLQARDPELLRLCVHRTLNHIYAQLIKYDALKRHSTVIVSASTTESDVKAKCKSTGNIDAAKVVGSVLAERAKKAGVNKIAFDRHGFKYHGRVKALAEAAREAGLQF